MQRALTLQQPWTLQRPCTLQQARALQQAWTLQGALEFVTGVESAPGEAGYPCQLSINKSPNDISKSSCNGCLVNSHHQVVAVDSVLVVAVDGAVDVDNILVAVDSRLVDWSLNRLKPIFISKSFN